MRPRTSKPLVGILGDVDGRIVPVAPPPFPIGQVLDVEADRSPPRRLSKLSEVVILKQLAESGEFRPVIDRTYALDEIVEAHRYVDQGQKKGNVIISLQ